MCRCAQSMKRHANESDLNNNPGDNAKRKRPEPENAIDQGNGAHGDSVYMNTDTDAKTGSLLYVHCMTQLSFELLKNVNDLMNAGIPTVVSYDCECFGSVNINIHSKNHQPINVQWWKTGEQHVVSTNIKELRKNLKYTWEAWKIVGQTSKVFSLEHQSCIDRTMRLQKTDINRTWKVIRNRIE